MKSYLPGKRVLIVEDNPVLAFDLKDFLTNAGALPVGPALDLTSAMKFARDNHLDAAILDIQLGDVERVWPLAQELKRHEVPVVFVSGNCTKKDFPFAFQSDVCLEKPATQEQILNEVGTLLAA